MKVKIKTVKDEEVRIIECDEVRRTYDYIVIVNENRRILKVHYADILVFEVEINY